VDIKKRVSVGLSAIVIVAVSIELLDLPVLPLQIVLDGFLSFLISGIFYMMLSAGGLGFLEEIEFEHISAMAVVVFILKQLLL
jgi:hypothetical protein